MLNQNLVAPSINDERLAQIEYIMEHWDELPERLQGKFEGICSTVADLVFAQPPDGRRAS